MTELCNKCKSELLNLKPGAGRFIEICEKCEITDAFNHIRGVKMDEYPQQNLLNAINSQMSEWRRFGGIDPVKIKGINCAVFRFKRKKFTVARLEWCEVHLHDKKAGMQDHWHWVTDYGSCHEIDVDDRILVLPVLELTIDKRY